MFGPFVFLVLHHEVLVRSLVLFEDHEFREIRSGDLHFFNVVKVCSHPRSAHRSCRLTGLVGFLRSNSYSSNSCNSDWKAILLNNVVVGRGYKLTADNRSLTEPPAGYDSVSAGTQQTLGEDTDKDLGPGRSRCQLELRRTRGV